MSLKLNIAYPQNGTQISTRFMEDNEWMRIIGKQIGDEFDGSLLKPEWKSHVFRITGGSDKTGLGMKIGVMTPNKVKLLLKPGT